MTTFIRHFFTLILVLSLWACTQSGEFIGGGLDGGGAMDQGQVPGGTVGGGNAAPSISDMGADTPDGTTDGCECKNQKGECVECGPGSLAAPDTDPGDGDGGDGDGDGPNSFKFMGAPDEAGDETETVFDYEPEPIDDSEDYDHYEANYYF